MREIKFRAWDKDAAMGKGAWDFATPEDSHWEQFWFITDPDTRGQYTGLKDKNGKEIYEGDVVRDMLGNLHEIAWQELGDAGETYGYGFNQEGPDMEVIGNIYENPELLTPNN